MITRAKLQARKGSNGRQRVAFWIGDYSELATDMKLGTWFYTLDGGKTYHGPYTRKNAARNAHRRRLPDRR